MTNLLGYIYAAIGSAVLAALITFGLASNYYDAQIVAINAVHATEKAVAVAAVNKTANAFQSKQNVIIGELRASLDEVKAESTTKVVKLEKSIDSLRGELRAGRVLIDRQSEALSRARADSATGIPATTAPPSGNPEGTLSAETSAALLDLVEEAELVRISLGEQRDYALKCHAAHTNLVKTYNALMASGAY